MFTLFCSKEYRKLTVICTLVMAMLINSAIPAYAEPNAPAVEDTWVQFVVLSVKNVDATNPEIPFVKDRISLAATVMSKYGLDVIDHDDLDTFREGQTKYYDDWVLAELPMNQVADFARLTLSMVEVDRGGRDDLLDRIAEEENVIARDNMIAYTNEILDELSGASVMTASSDANSPFVVANVVRLALASVAGAIAASFIATIWDQIVGIWQDDAFELVYVEVPNNSSVSSGTVEFEDLGGKYRLEYEWRWVNKSVISAAQGADSPTVSYNPDYRFDDLMAEITELWEAAQQTNKVYMPIIGR